MGAIMINTGLKGKLNKSILDNIIGQLSDGMWENSRAMEHYWPFADIKMGKDIFTGKDDESVYIAIRLPGSESYHNYHHPNNCYSNWFIRCDKLNKDKTAIKQWFAKKIKQLISAEAKKYPSKMIKFNDKCEATSDFMWDSESHEDHRISDIYKAYKILMG